MKVEDILSNMGVFHTMGDITNTVGVVLSTVGDSQYQGGYHDACGGYHEYCGCDQYRGDTIRRNLSTMGDVMSTMGVFSAVGVLK